MQICYKNEYIRNVDIYNGESINSIIQKIKTILFYVRNFIYRPAFPHEIIEKTTPWETLEYLLDKGVIDTNIGIIIKHKGATYPYSFYNYYYIQNKDVFNV